MLVSALTPIVSSPAFGSTIMAPGSEPDNEVKSRIALVEPTFTYAAYQNGSFYNFYHKYRPTPIAASVTTDLHLLTDRGIPSEPFVHYKAPEKGPIIPHSVFHRTVEEHVRAFAPEANVTMLGDQDIHKGTIFENNQTNAYDLLVFYHNEYFSQQGYDNLRRFVENGGTVLFTMSNVMYAEVAYDEVANTITFVKGHDWEFDGKSARKSVGERWPEETREWAGSNFMKMPTWMGVQFANNPFNYTHTEEQYVTNPDSRILRDYGAQAQNNTAFNATVATYEMDYGRGKVIMIGLFSNTLVQNQAFWKFFDDIILPHAILPALTQLTLLQSATEGPEPRVYWKMNSGSVTDMIVDGRLKSIYISLERTSGIEDVLMIVLPKDLLSGLPSELKVQVSDVVTKYEMTECDSDVALKIPLSIGADEIKIFYAYNATTVL